jgi:hypothetical protein
MSFELHVEFAGLCLYVVHEDENRVAVLMPDARPSGNPDRKHVDGSPAEPHVGYIRLDAANLPERMPAPSRPDKDPRYELIHRLDRQVVLFDDAFEPEPMEAGLVVPKFDEFAPELELLPDLFGPTPEPALLMRSILNGGTLNSELTDETWKLPGHLNPGAPEMEGKFASSVTWIRTVQGSSTAIRIADFAGNVEQEFFLAPVEGESEVHVKVANLCAHNPLEWDDMPLRKVMGDDKDFKWLYELHRPRDGKSYAELLAGAPVNALPIPIRLHIPPNDSGSNDCIPASTKKKF